MTTRDDMKAFATACEARAVVTARPPTGYVQAALARWTGDAAAAAAPVLHIQRRWDDLFWPHARAGFFQLKEHIPIVLKQLRIATPGPSP